MDADPFGQALRRAEQEANVRLGIVHVGGVPWYDAPAPPRRHGHWVQTSGVLTSGMAVERCPCGAIRRPGEPWVLLDEPRVAARRSWWRRAKRGDEHG